MRVSERSFEFANTVNSPFPVFSLNRYQNAGILSVNIMGNSLDNRYVAGYE